MSGWLRKSKICFMKGERQAKMTRTAIDALTVRLRNSIRWLTSGCSFAGSSGASSSLLFSAMIVLYR